MSDLDEAIGMKLKSMKPIVYTQEEERLLKVTSEVVYKDSKRIIDDACKNHRSLWKQKFQALPQNPTEFEVFKAHADAKHEAYLAWSKEFKSQRWHLMIKDAIRADKQS
jgi:hypothetical protein